MRKYQHNTILIAIVILAAFFRFYNLNWDQGHHLHPDERAIVMFSLPLHFPSSISEFFSPQSPLNPHFFAYGNLSLYLLKGAGFLLSNFDPSYLSYEKINLAGRIISAIADMGTLMLLFLLAKKLFNQTVGLLASFFYAISAFPIQASHFYAVDTPLTFFILLTLYQLIKFYEKPSLKNSILVGLCFGASLATKISAIPLLVAIAAAIAIDFLLLVVKQPHKPRIWFPHVPRFLKRFASDGVVIIASTAIMFVILQPYAIIDFNAFWRQNLEQSQMTRDAFTFPYTLQYVGKIPYIYELKNIFFWGQGPILATLSFLGVFYVIFIIIKKQKERKWAQEFILMIFFLSYFAVVGNFSIGFMRYMLLLYPLFCLFGSLIAYRLLMILKEKFRYWKLVVLVGIGSILVWPLSFMNIYTKPNTRVLASQWIFKNIPTNKTLAVEHWDDQLPIGGVTQYNIITLPIYESEYPIQWQFINDSLAKTDYLIIASNRLYTPLQRIAKNCETWHIPQGRCPKNASAYYEKLFSGQLGFKKVAEFKNPPTIPFINIPINDQNADESFTVYDHPKIMIFKKQ